MVVSDVDCWCLVDILAHVFNNCGFHGQLCFSTQRLEASTRRFVAQENILYWKEYCPTQGNIL